MVISSRHGRPSCPRSLSCPRRFSCPLFTSNASVYIDFSGNLSSRVHLLDCCAMEKAIYSLQFLHQRAHLRTAKSDSTAARRCPERHARSLIVYDHIKFSAVPISPARCSSWQMAASIEMVCANPMVLYHMCMAGPWRKAPLREQMEIAFLALCWSPLSSVSRFALLGSHTVDAKRLRSSHGQRGIVTKLAEDGMVWCDVYKMAGDGVRRLGLTPNDAPRQT